jgi:hypothetical protein
VLRPYRSGYNNHGWGCSEGRYTYYRAYESR